VTEWAVAPIPTDPAPPATPAAAASSAAAGLAVDDEPEDAVAAPVRTLTAVRDGAAPSAAPEYTYTDDDAPDDEEFPPPVEDAPLPPRAAVAVERPAPAASPVAERPAAVRAPRAGGIERVGEAVVRQVLGATFVREEPYTPPTRFN